MSPKLLLVWSLTAAVVPALAGEPTPALTAAQLVERNAAARGGLEAWRKIETLAWAGHVERAGRGGRVPFVLEQKRPDRTRFEITLEGQRAVRVFDGSAGWNMRATATGRLEVQPYTADELKYARGAPVIDGPLMEYAARGATVTLAGLYDVEGRKTYALDLRLPSGSTYRVWIDGETFLELRYDREFVNGAGRPTVTSVYLADYREVEGLKMPFSIETGGPDGKSRDKLVIERVALNPPLDERRFAKPGAGAPRRRGVTVDTRSAAMGNPARPAR